MVGLALWPPRRRRVILALLSPDVVPAVRVQRAPGHAVLAADHLLDILAARAAPLLSSPFSLKAETSTAPLLRR